MKGFLDTNIIKAVLITAVSVAIIIAALSFIKTDNGISSLLPGDQSILRDSRLVSMAPISDKLILFIEGDSFQRADAKGFLENKAKEYGIELRSIIPGSADIDQIYKYIQTNSLLLYPYEHLPTPFSSEEVVRRLNIKQQIIEMNPFQAIDRPFIMDPLIQSADILSLIKDSGYKLSGGGSGILSDDGKAALYIYSTGVLPEEYDKSGIIADLNKVISEYCRDNQFKGFIISSHLFYYNSYTAIKKELTIIFIISIVLTIIIFIVFFRSPRSIIFGLMPIACGFACAFLFLAIFKRNIGGIALAFGATTTGISIDYSIHYLIKRGSFNGLAELRKNIGLSMLLGYITTIIGFVVLLFSGIGTLVDISLFGIVMITAVYLTAWFVLQPIYPPDGKNLDFKLLPVIRNPRFAAIITTILLLLTGVGLPFMKLEDNVMGLDRKHQDIRKNIDYMTNFFSETTDTLFLCFEGESRAETQIKSLEALKILKGSGVGFITPALFMPDDSIIQERKQVINGIYNENDFINASQNSVFGSEIFNQWTSQIDNISETSLTEPPEFLKNMFNNYIVNLDERYFMLIPVQNRSKLDTIRSKLTESGFTGYFIIDFVNNAKGGLVKFEQTALLLLFVAIILVFIVLSVSYKSIRSGFSAIIPSLAGTIAVLGVAGLAGFKINIMHIAGLIVITGVGVDYGIFITGAIKSGEDKKKLAITYKSIFTCALTTLAGFGTLIISGNTAVFSLGYTTIAGIITAFLTAYLIVPAIAPKTKTEIKEQ